MAVLVARTAWYGLLVPVPQQLLGNRTKWPYWPVGFASKPTKVFRPYHAVVRRVISIVHESTNHSRLADPYHAVVGMNGGLYVSSSHHRAATVIRYAERQPKSAIGWLRLKISLGIAGS
jgi:hypothetical protein